MTNKLYKPLLIDSIKAVVDLPKQRFIDFSGNICTKGVKALGVSDVEIEANQYAPIGVLGIFLVEAGNSVTVGVEVTSDDNGKAVVANAEDKINGYALDSANAGEVIRIVRGI